MIRKPSNHLSSTSRRNFLRASAGTGLAFAAGVRPRPARAATEKILFQLDWIPFGRHAPYYAALENGFYAEKGMDVTIAQGAARSRASERSSPVNLSSSSRTSR
jgi:ABC-type nitrate/sulfonate/bicarbonate transport system substrate-binding protein